MVDSSGQVGEGGDEAGKLDKDEKQLAKYELSRLALDSEDSAVVEPYVRVCGIRSRFGDMEW